MNNRANELRLKAGIAQIADSLQLVVINKEGKVIDPIIGLEKFAELIVKECADFVDNAISDGGIDGHSLKEHFGVE